LPQGKDVSPDFRRQKEIAFDPAEKKEIKKVDFSRKACYNHHESGKYIRMYFFCEAKKIVVLWRSPEFCPKSKKEKGQ
jgi:hypothetical protein